MPLWILTSPRDWRSAVNSTLQFSMTLMMKFMTLSKILFILNILSTFAEPYYRQFCTQTLPWLHFSTSFNLLLGCSNQYIIDYLFLLFLCGILFILLETVRVCNRIIDFFSNLCDQDLPHHRWIRCQSSVTEDSPFWGEVLSDQNSISFHYLFGYVFFFLEFSQLQSQSIMDRHEFLKP